MNNTEGFLGCGTDPVGLYPIVDSVEWIEKLLPLGVKTVQLRIKTQQEENILAKVILESIKLARHFDARLFINDYWELAIRCGAYGIHLGQEDLIQADLGKIQRAGLRLGVSTHSREEMERALAIKPSYIAYGPIYPTQTKDMSFKPQGLARLRVWVHTLHYPIVAIGGINAEHFPEVLATGVNGIAMISAITQAEDPVSVTQELLRLMP